MEVRERSHIKARNFPPFDHLSSLFAEEATPRKLRTHSFEPLGHKISNETNLKTLKPTAAGRHIQWLLCHLLHIWSHLSINLVLKHCAVALLAHKQQPATPKYEKITT